MRRTLTFVFVAVLIVATVLGVACGGSGSGTSFVPPAPTSTATFDAGSPPPPFTDAGLTFLDAPPPQTVLILSPAGSTLLVTAPGATVQLTAVLLGTTTPVPASWSVDLPLVGSIDANGLFTASGQLGGVVTVSAQTETAHGATTLTVDLQSQDDPGDAGAATEGALREGGAADPAFRWLYPYDQTVFPKGLAAPTLMMDGEPATSVRIHVKSSTLDYEAFYGASSPTSVDFTKGAWTTITESAAPGDPLTIEATKISASGVTGPIRETWTIAQGSLKGTVYYNTYDSPLNNGSGAVMRIRPGESAGILFGGCTVCHAVSADGSTMVALGSTLPEGVDGGEPDSWFYTLGSSFDLTQDAGTLHAENDSNFGFAGLYPDGTLMLSCASMNGGSVANWEPNVPGMGFLSVPAGDRPTKLYDPKTGAHVPAPGFDGTITHALMPAFSPDGQRVVFNDWDHGQGHSLAVMSFARATNTFSSLVDVVDSPDGGAATAPFLGWPYFTPDSATVLYNTVDWGDYATWNNLQRNPGKHANKGDLQAVDVASRVVTSLDAANGIASGKPYLPYGDAEAHMNFEPTILPVAVGGYYWVVFTSRREYGNDITDADPYEDHPARRKKLWVAAIDLNGTPGKDSSHPAFYLPGQEHGAGNMRGFWALDPCVQNGSACGSGDQCCSGFCRQSSAGDGGPLLSCVPQPQGCSQEFEKCGSSSDCCGAAQGYQCLNGHCAQPAPK